MSIGKIVKTEFFIYLNKELYKIAHSWEEFKTVKEEIFTKYSGYSWIHGSSNRFSVYVNDETRDAITYWYRMRETTNLKDSQGNIVCVNDELIDNISKHKCWLLCLDDELYVGFDHWRIPNINNVCDLSNFTITKRHSTF